MRENMSWADLWMKFAFLVAQRSKDPNTQCGCVLVSPDNREIAIGYNGFAAGIPENDERWQRPDKYDRVIHSEANAILNAKRDVSGWCAYITMTPCHQCANLLVQANIKTVVFQNEPQNKEAFKYDFAIKTLSEGGVTVVQRNENGQVKIISIPIEWYYDKDGVLVKPKNGIYSDL